MNKICLTKHNQTLRHSQKVKKVAGLEEPDEDVDQAELETWQAKAREKLRTDTERKAKNIANRKYCCNICDQVFGTGFQLRQYNKSLRA